MRFRSARRLHALRLSFCSSSKSSTRIGIVGATLLAALAASATAQVSLNEIRIDQPGTDNDEYFELAGAPATPLDGFTYLVIGDGSGGSGVIEAVVDLTGQTIDAGGFFVAAEGSFSLGTTNLTNDLNFENSDNVTHLLVQGFSGANGQDLDTDDDGTLDTQPWTSVADCLALVEDAGSGELTYCTSSLGPDGTFVPGHAILCPSGWTIGAFDTATGDDTPGASNTCADTGPQVALSEIRIDQPGGDDDEYFELEGTAGGSLDGFTYLVIGDGTGGSGVIEAAVDLTGSAIDANGFFVAAESTFTLGIANLTTSLNFENSDNVTHLLVQDFTGANGDDLDIDDDGIFDTLPWSEITDCVALVETVGGGELTYCTTSVGPDGTFVPGHSLFCATEWQIGPFDPVGGADTPGAANACAEPPIDVALSEIRIDQPGGDDDEYFELEGTAGGSLDGFTYLVIGDGTGGSGVIEAVVDLTGAAIDPNGFFVAAESTFTLGIANLTTSLNFENSDNVTHLLVQDFTGANGDDLDVDDDGTFDVEPWTAIADCIALVETVGSGELTYCTTSLGPDGTFVPGHAGLCPTGWEILDFDPANGADTPGAANVCGPGAEAQISEIRIDQSGADDDEYVELAGTAGGTVDGLTYLVIGDGSGGSGVVESITALSGVLDANGFFVIAESTFTLGIANQTGSLNFENSDNVTHLLVSGFAGSNGQDLDTNDDGVLDIEPWSGIVDCIALVESPGSGDLTYCADSVGPDGTFVPAHSFDCPGGFQIGAFDTADGTDTPGAANACVAPLVINEVDYDQPSSDTAEFVEILNTSGGDIDLDAAELVFVNGNDGSTYMTIDLPSVLLAAGDHYVVCADATTVANCDLVGLTTGIQNGAPDAIGLNFQGSLVDAVSYEGSVLGFVEGSGDGLSDSGSSGDDFQSLSRAPDGQDTDQNNVDFVRACTTPGLPNNTSTSNGACTGVGPLVEIYDIQGPGAASPFAGQAVATADNVVTAVGTDGFFIQTPSARSDADIDTSDGIFVFTGSAPSVAAGDLVNVSGVVVEFFELTELTGGPVVTVVGSETLPAPVVFNATVPSPDPATPSCAIEYECYEGMLIEIASGVVGEANQSFGTDPVAEVYVTASDRAFRETGIIDPGLPGLPVWDGNPEVFELDPDRLGLANRVINAGSSFSASGVLGFEFGGYELWPTTLLVTDRELPESVEQPRTGELRVGTLNLFRLFDDIDDGSGGVIDPAVYQLRLEKASAHIRDVLRSPDILAVQEAEKLGVLQDLADQIALDDPTISYTPYLVEGNDLGGIDVGYLVGSLVTVSAVTQLGADEIFSFDGSLLHDRPPLLLEGTYSGGVQPLDIAVLGIHQRSLNNIDDPSDGDRVRQKRLAQAQSVAQMSQDVQSTSPDAKVVVLGDFNAFQFTDGYVDVVGQIRGDVDPTENLLSGPDLVDPNLINMVDALDPSEQYSFVFNGSAQVLDHILVSESLAPFVQGIEVGRGNADAAEGAIDEPGALRASDHDGLVLTLSSIPDADGDTIADGDDLCADTTIPESVPTVELGRNRWALVDGDTEFDTSPDNRRVGNRGSGFTLEDTAGCSCEQIIDILELGQGHVKFGCSTGVMNAFRRSVSM